MQLRNLALCVPALLAAFVSAGGSQTSSSAYAGPTIDPQKASFTSITNKDGGTNTVILHAIYADIP